MHKNFCQPLAADESQLKSFARGFQLYAKFQEKQFQFNMLKNAVSSDQDRFQAAFDKEEAEYTRLQYKKSEADELTFFRSYFLDSGLVQSRQDRLLLQQYFSIKLFEIMDQNRVQIQNYLRPLSEQ